MVESNQASNNADQANGGQNDRRPYGDMYWVYIIGAWGLIGLILVATCWPNLTDRTKFFVSTLWVLVTAFAVIAQAVIYKKQWAIMERQLKLMALSQSAYLSVGEFVIPPIRNYRLVVNGKLFNRGNTPALNLRKKMQIALGTGTPPPGWGQFDWNVIPNEMDSTVIAAGDFVNFTTPALTIDAKSLNEINERKQAIVIDGQCRYRDNVGDLLIYVFGLTVELDPPRTHIRYQEHRRESDH
jgi:hypothetical protein